MKRFPIIRLNNEGEGILCELALPNEATLGADGYGMIAPYGDAPNRHPEGFVVIQRHTKADAEKMVSAFNERRQAEEDVFAGVPIYKRHPRRDGVAQSNDDRTRMGQYDDIQAREDGLYGKPRITKRGKQFGVSNRYPTAHWFCQVTGKEGGKLVLQPFELEHVGLTDKPNLPVAPMFNEDVAEKYGLDNGKFRGNQHTQPNAMDETKAAFTASEKAHAADPADAKLHESAAIAHRTAAKAHRQEGNERSAKWHDAKAKAHDETAQKISTPTPATGQANQQPRKESPMDPKLKLLLIGLLAAAGTTLANDAPDDVVATALAEGTTKVGKLSESGTALTNAQQEHVKATQAAAEKEKELNAAVETATGKVSSLENELKDTKGKLVTTETEAGKLRVDLKVSETVLANEQKERTKATETATRLNGELVAATTAKTIAETALANEQSAHTKTVTSLGNAKKAIVDMCVAMGKIFPSQRKQLETMLANEVDFGQVCDTLAKGAPVIKMVPLINDATRQTANAMTPGKQYAALINQVMEKDKISRHQATIKVKQSEEGKALLALMHNPESGMMAVAR